jgi:ribosomal-protein-alanine N-acetyltransferase
MPSSRPARGEGGIETMRESDLDAVVAIERTAFAAPWSRESFGYELRNPWARNLVARRAGEVVGYLCAWIVAEEIKINNVAVRHDARGRGIGRALLEHALRQARSEGCREASLEVRPSNLTARHLYRDLGFRAVGRRKAYYRDTGEDAILMFRELI